METQPTPMKQNSRDTLQPNSIHKTPKASLHKRRRRAAIVVTCAVILTFGLAVANSRSATPRTQLHYAANGNFDHDNTYLPGKAGFNLADVHNLRELQALPEGVRALVWVGQCNGVDAAFVRAVEPFLGDAKVFGFYLMDDPDPRPIPGTATPLPRCPAEHLKAASAWLHARMPQTKTFVALMNMSSSTAPSFPNTYSSDTSHVDLFGLAPYPCRSNIPNCDYDMIDRYVAAAERAGIPKRSIVPTFQTFGGGDWITDNGARYRLPTAAEELEMIGRWERLVGASVFDFAYSWGSQNSDLALHDAPELQAVLWRQNSTNEPGSLLLEK